MNIEIKELTSELMEDYLTFFDMTPHSTKKDEHRCYCVCWTSTHTDMKECSTAEKRRVVAASYIKNQFIQGYLAYHQDKVVGWCNTNTKADCYECISWLMFMDKVQKDEAKVKSVFCFTIAPEYRHQGIAKALLKKVCEDAKREGYDYVEAYPNEEFIDTEQDFMGPIQLFKELDFIECYKINHKVVMRKQCK